MNKEWKVGFDGRNVHQGDIIPTIFENRNVNIDRFLNPRITDILPLSEFNNIDKAFKIVAQGLEDNKSFLIWADVDVDGCTSGAIMFRYLHNFTSNVQITINNGKLHGIKECDVSKINADIIIIVDSINEAECYNKFIELGKQVIVLDHHIPPSDNYDNITLVTSARGYSNHHLSGSGVVWKFCKYCDDMFLTDYANNYVDLATCGIIADMVDLTSSENRVICNLGFNHLVNTGVKKIVGNYKFNSQSVSFSIAPLINAAQRMNLNKSALELFLTDDTESIDNTIKQLKQAKSDQSKEISTVLPKINTDFEKQIDNSVLIFIIETSHNICGLLANKLIDMYQRPVIVVTDCGNKYCGSLRGYGTDNFKQVCENCGAIAQGHENAAGITIRKTGFDDFKFRINQEINFESLKIINYADVKLSLSQIGTKLINDFKVVNTITGAGFPALSVLIDNIKNYTVSTMSNGKHLKIVAGDITLIKWNFEDDIAQFDGRPITVIGGLDMSYFGRKLTKQIIISDYKVGVSKMVHLHTHTMYSLLDATIKPEELAEKLLKIGQDTIAITDHGNLYGAVEFYHKLSDKGIKVITGCEVYICDDVNEKNKDSKYYHLIFLCKNEQGRLNLNKLVSKSTKYKYFGKPRIDFDMLKEYHEGLICLSACMAGELSRAIENNDIELAIHTAKKYKNLFGEDYYIEYQAHENEEQQKINSQLIMIANKLNIPFVVTCDAHYLNKEDKEYHSIFIRINQKREPNEIYDDCYIQTEDEVREKCWLTAQYNEQAIKNTQIIADKCQNTIPLSPPIIPHVDIPRGYKSESEYLKKLCNNGFKEKGFSTWEYDDWVKYLTIEYTDKNGEEHSYLPFEFHSAKEVKKKYIDRARYEMNALIKMGFEGYYLLVHSYVNVAKRRGIARGSGGGSLLAYLIGIVDIDPIKYGLYFERFIDVGALDLLADGTITKKELKIPDFDIDFSPTDRDKAMQNIIERYHSEKVVCLGQFGYIWAKGAIKDIGKVLGIPFETTNTMTKKLSDETIEKALESGVLDEYKNQYPKLFEYASKLSGLPKSFGVHPCGKCICTRPADYYNALEYSDTANSWVLQGDMHTADDLGLVKIDLLGLRTLDVIYDVLEMIGKDYDYIAPHKINTNDKKVWSEFENGHTDCIFQFESVGMKKMLHDMKCNTIENLSAANALYRPGSKEYIPNYVNRKNGVEKIEYLNMELEPILKNSYGIIVFQEQLIEIGRLAGLRNPDELRKATAKKKPKLMAKIEPELKNGLIKRGWSVEQVNALWGDILKFAKYSFNKSHSSAYALTAYISMFLKVHHSAEFFTACINSYSGELSEVAKTINEAKRMGVKIVFDSIEIITPCTVCYNNTVHLGVDTIKGCGEQIAKSLNGISQCDDFHQVLNSYKDFHISLSQLKVLIQLGFFVKYGKSQTLLDMCNIYEKYNKSQYFKDEVDFPESIINKYFKETAKKYIVKDKEDFLKAMCQNIESRNISIRQKMRVQNEYLGYISYINPKAENYGFVIDVAVKYSPKVKVYRLDTGEFATYKVSKRTYQESPISINDVIIFLAESRNKSKLVNGKWVKILDEYEDWITNYTFYK